MPQETLIPFLAVFVAVLLAVVGIWFLIVPVLARRRALVERRMKTPGDSSPSIVLDKLPGRKAAGWSARFDQAFQDLVDQTGLDITPNTAAALILLSGMILAAF